MSLSHLLMHAREATAQLPKSQGHDRSSCVLFLSISDGRTRAHTLSVRAADFNQAWQQAAKRLHTIVQREKIQPRWLRVDQVDQTRSTTWRELRELLTQTKRNYFPFGIAFDQGFKVAILEPELGAHALLYDNEQAQSSPNAVNLKNYGLLRHGQALQWPEADETPVWLFNTQAIFSDGQQLHTLQQTGSYRGYRQVPDWNASAVHDIVTTATRYLADQVKPGGEYHYGWFPCFDRAIPTYNALRHASSTYALLEGWELTQDQQHLAAIERALKDLTTRLIKTVVLPDGSTAAFLVDLGHEIKLGGNAVCLLALVKYTELTGNRQYLPLLEQLALGIVHMQQPDGSFVHVLNHPDLSLKERSRIIYYDGEAAFGLMRLYGLSKDDRWLACVERAFEHFIDAKHWQAHDHWLSYCVNELTLYRPDERYYRFGLDNVRGHLDFVLQRITTFPTLLELMMAARQMIERLQTDPDRSHLLQDFDLAKFHQALEHRARYLLNGHFWPELAMFFKNPGRIVGSFFIRHHTFRVRIDDVEHYLSGYVAYWKYLRQRSIARATEATDVPTAATPDESKAGTHILFLQENLRPVGNGIEVSGIRRAKLFKEQLGLSTAILTSQFNPGIHAYTQKLKDEGKLPSTCDVANVYEWLPRMYRSGLIRTLAPLKAESDWKVFNSSPLETAIGKVRRRSYQTTTSRPMLVAEEFIVDEVHVLVRKTYRLIDSGSQSVLMGISMQSFDGHALVYSTESDFVCALMAVNLNRQVAWHFVVDKNRAYRSLRNSAVARNFRHTVTAVLHNTHRREDGGLKGSYRHLMEDPSSCDLMVTLTHEQATDLRSEGIPAKRLHHIPHAIEIPELRDRIAGPSRLIYLARYAPEKRHALLFDAFATVLRDVPDAELHTYGSGTLQPDLEQRALAAELGGQVHVHGYTNDIESIYASASMAVMSSKEEGFPLFGLECLANGCPLVAFAVKYGPRDLLENQQAGLLVPAGDGQALARAIVALLKDPARRLNMQKNARLSAQRFAPAQVASRWQEWWRQASEILDPPAPKLGAIPQVI